MMVKHADLLVAEMESLTSNISRLDDSVGGVALANWSLMHASRVTNRHLLESVNRLESRAEETIRNVRTVNDSVQQAAAEVPPVAADLQWIHAIPDSAWSRFSPFRRYQVTPEVRSTVGRAMKGFDGDQFDGDQKEWILCALDRLKEERNGLKEKETMSVRKFREGIERHATTCAQGNNVEALLDQWLPLIVKVSRVQE